MNLQDLRNGFQIFLQCDFLSLMIKLHQRGSIIGVFCLSNYILLIMRNSQLGQMKFEQIKEELRNCQWVKNEFKLETIEKIYEIHEGNEQPSIGRGGYGYIVKIKDNSNETVALKIVESNKQAMHICLQEIKIQKVLYEKSLLQNYIPKIRDYHIDASLDRYYIAMDYFPMGDLAKYLKDPQNVFTTEDLYCLAYSLFLVLFQSHKLNHAHYDIKPQNIFIRKNVDNKLEFLLGDWGSVQVKFNRFESSQKINMENCNATKGYIAPESNSNTSDSKKHDIFAVGKTLLEVGLRHKGVDLTNAEKYHAQFDEHIKWKIDHEPALQDLDVNFKMLLQRSLSYDVNDRIDALQALQLAIPPFSKQIAGKLNEETKTSGDLMMNNFRQSIKTLQENKDMASKMVVIQAQESIYSEFAQQMNKLASFIYSHFQNGCPLKYLESPIRYYTMLINFIDEIKNEDNNDWTKHYSKYLLEKNSKGLESTLVQFKNCEFCLFYLTKILEQIMLLPMLDSCNNLIFYRQQNNMVGLQDVMELQKKEEKEEDNIQLLLNLKALRECGKVWENHFKDQCQQKQTIVMSKFGKNFDAYALFLGQLGSAFELTDEQNLVDENKVLTKALEGMPCQSCSDVMKLVCQLYLKRLEEIKKLDVSEYQCKLKKYQKSVSLGKVVKVLKKFKNSHEQKQPQDENGKLLDQNRNLATIYLTLKKMYKYSGHESNPAMIKMQRDILECENGFQILGMVGEMSVCVKNSSLKLNFRMDRQKLFQIIEKIEKK